MERGLSEPSLPQMMFTLAGEQTFAEQPLCPLQHEPLVEMLVIRDQCFFDKVWVIEEKRFLRTELEIADITILSRKVLKEWQRSATIFEHRGQRDFSSRARRKAAHTLCF
jgi:hypothetical protein